MCVLFFSFCFFAWVFCCCFGVFYLFILFCFFSLFVLFLFFNFLMKLRKVGFILSKRMLVYNFIPLKAVLFHRCQNTGKQAGN